MALSAGSANTRGQCGHQVRQMPSPPPPPPNLMRHETQGGFVPAKVKHTRTHVKLEINLHQPNHYRAGDTVSGSVDLSSERNGGQDVDVGSISITFSGRCKTSRPVRATPTCKRTLQLFAHQRILSTGPARLHAPQKLPFLFNFPSSCSTPDIVNFETGPFFNSDANQTLPISFADESHIDKASVVYELKCELLAPDFKGYYMQGSFFKTLCLNLYSLGTVQEPVVEYTRYARSFTHQSLDLLTPVERSYHERPLTLGQKLGVKSTTTDRLPKASFTATVLIPSAAVIGQPLHLRLHIDHNTETSTVSQRPIVHLTKVQVFLRIETSICAMKYKSVKGDLDQTGWTTGAQIAEKEFVQAIPRVEHLDLRKVMDLTLDPNLQPSFKSFNIARTYSLRAAGTIRCGGTSFAIMSGMRRCTFLAGGDAVRLPRYDGSLLATDREEAQLAGEVPPPYANAAQSMAPPYAPPQ